MIVTFQDLNSVGEDIFERLIKTLLISVIGKGVKPFSYGKDGAREATFSGTTNYPSNIDCWQGNWIFQVKFSDISMGINRARDQVKYLINGELIKLKKYDYIKEGLCENYIYITNVPFTGESKVGLHDYIEKKKIEYKVKNFDYWDGERIAGFLNHYPNVKDVFFSKDGFETVPDEVLDYYESIFIKPKQYDNLKNDAKTNRLVNIVGQPHVGKSALAYFLAHDLYIEQGLNNVLWVGNVDEINGLPKIENTVIIFDDLYGDLSYSEIGRKSKYINALSRDNYIIITTRDYIFREARANSETIESIQGTEILLQEGSYDDGQLIAILFSHVNYRKSKGQINTPLEQLIKRYKRLIISKLRYPHNIKLFIDSLDNTITNKRKLEVYINSSKKIETLILIFVNKQRLEFKNILFAASLGKINDVKVIVEICSYCWEYSWEIVDECLKSNDRILTYQNGKVKFLHPSFKSAILENFQNKNSNDYRTILLKLLAHEFNNHKLLYNQLIIKLIPGLDREQVLKILSLKDIGKHIQEVCWAYFIKRDFSDAINVLIEHNNSNLSFGSLRFRAFVNAKDLLEVKTVMNFINYLFTIRSYKKRMAEELIVLYGFRVRKNLNMFFPLLDETNQNDLILKIRLLGVIGTKFPDDVFKHLIGFSINSSVTVRAQVYKAINSFPDDYAPKVLSAIKDFLTFEKSRGAILKLLRSELVWAKKTL